MLGVGVEVEFKCHKRHPAVMQISSHVSIFTGWEHNFSHPSWITAVYSPPAAASSSSMLIDKIKHQPIGKKMNGGKVMRTKRRSGHWQWTTCWDGIESTSRKVTILFKSTYIVTVFVL